MIENIHFYIQIYILIGIYWALWCFGKTADIYGVSKNMSWEFEFLVYGILDLVLWPVSMLVALYKGIKKRFSLLNLIYLIVLIQILFLVAKYTNLIIFDNFYVVTPSIIGLFIIIIGSIINSRRK
jgi:hypothetical protein